MYKIPYTRLDEKVDSTRLIKVLQNLPDTLDGTDATINCELIHVTFASKPKYDALSYTWGSSDSVKTIWVNGAKVSVRENLYLALHALKILKESGLFWIDAICINQDDLRERNRQVSLMAFIYSRAQTVIVWLGYIGDDETTRAYNAAKGYPTDPEERWIAGHPYWRRVWIIQEICLSRRIQCLYREGGRLVAHDWTALMETLIQAGADHSIDIRRPMKLHQQRIGRHGTLNLLERLLEIFADSQCQEPRDKIYGFLGLAHDCQNGSLVVDYSKSLFDLYFEVMRFQYNAKPLEDPLPSAIDRSMRLVAFSRLLQHVFEGAFQSTIIDSKAQLESKLLDLVWTARGFIEGRVIHIGPSHNETVSSFEATKTWKNSFEQYYEEPSDLARLRQQDEAFTLTLLEMDDTEIQKVRPAASIGLAFPCHEEWGWGARLGPADRRSFEIWEKEYGSKGSGKPSLDAKISPTNIENQLLDVEPRRFLGSNLCMGLAPPQAQIGDFICRFWGCNIAALLRGWPDRGLQLVGRVDMATAWIPTEIQPIVINQRMHYEGGGVVNLRLSFAALQELTC